MLRKQNKRRPEAVKQLLPDKYNKWTYSTPVNKLQTNKSLCKHQKCVKLNGYPVYSVVNSVVDSTVHTVHTKKNK